MFYFLANTPQRVDSIHRVICFAFSYISSVQKLAFFVYVQIEIDHFCS